MRPASIIVVCGLVAAACTGGDSSPTTPEPPPVASTGAPTTPTTGATSTTILPTTTVTADDSVVDMGEAPWRLAPLDQGAVDEVYLLEWRDEAGAPEACPLLVFADLGDQASDARARRAANQGEMLVAWDRLSGPGHDAMSDPCDDCGRGVIGLGTWQATVFEDRPVTRVWDDGSRARTFAGSYGTEGFLEVEGFGCSYWLWTHLGEEHLDFLLSRLRRVEGAP
jgi:hypothetical protein